MWVRYPCKPLPLNPQPSTLNPQHSTLNTQHSTLNTQHSTLNTQHSTLNPQPIDDVTPHLNSNQIISGPVGYDCLPTYLPTYLPACLPTYLLACMHACLPTYLPSYLPTYLPGATTGGLAECPTYLRPIRMQITTHPDLISHGLDNIWNTLFE